VKGHARNIMTERVTAVSPQTPLSAIVATLVAEKIGGVPVVDRQDAVVGFVSEVDVVQALLRDDPDHTEARDIMSHPVATIDEFATAEEVIDTLRCQQIHHLPVIRGGKLVGIISPVDVLRFYVERAMRTPPEPA
jgi:CBS domain-containing protein